MEFTAALFFILVAVIVGLISTIATIIVGVAIANHLSLTGILWWAFIIVFWCVITRIIGKSLK